MKDSRDEWSLFGRGPGALVPRVILAVVFLETSEFLRLLHFKVPLMLLAISDGVFQVRKFDDHVGERVARRNPSHQTIFPPFPRVKFNAPFLSGVRSALHGVLGGLENPHTTMLDVKFGDAGQWRQILLHRADDSNSLFLILGQCLVVGPQEFRGGNGSDQAGSAGRDAAGKQKTG